MVRTHVDGVTTFWQEAPAPFAAALIFGAGTRHETFRTVGVAHLAEHLIMSALPGSRGACNASVDLDAMTFYAEGKVEHVLSFIESVCLVANEIPLDRLDKERRILEREDGDSCHPALGWALSTRFGLRGPGVAAARGPGLDKIGAPEIREFADRLLTKANAVLVLTGPPPDDLRLPLERVGERARNLLLSSTLELPGFIPGEVSEASWSYLVPAGVGAMALGRIVRDRFEHEARHERGLVYDVGLEADQLDEDNILVCHHTDAHGRDTREVVTLVSEILADLAVHGATTEELERDHRGWADAFDDVWLTFSDLMATATRHLRGFKTHDKDELLALSARLTPADVAGWARRAAETLLVAVPHTIDPFPGLPDLSEAVYGVPVDLEEALRAGRRFPRRLTRKSPLDLGVRASDAGILLTARGERVGGFWHDVVAVGRSENIRLLILANGATPWFCNRHLKDASELFALVDEQTADRFFVLRNDEVPDC